MDRIAKPSLAPPLPHREVGRLDDPCRVCVSVRDRGVDQVSCNRIIWLLVARSFLMNEVFTTLFNPLILMLARLTFTDGLFGVGYLG